ncbi:MAG: TAXI family TRAP transporter solute-binding subunit [bacterium]|nr:TAXI family TRAP transporter solute-binding subunit [bacterium]
MTHRFPALLLLALLVFLGGCASDGESGGGRRFLSVGTAPVGGAFFPVGGAIAQTLTDNAGDHGWQVTAEATKGSQENIRRLAGGELDLALSNAAITYHAVRGEGGWDQAYEMRAVMTLAPNVALFITPNDSGVKTMADLRGKRVVMGPAGAGFEFFLRPLIGAHGLTYDDLNVLNAGQTQAVDMLSDGSAAAAFLGGAVPTASITQAASSRNIHFVPFDAAALEKLTGDYLFFNRATIPAGTYTGQDEEFQGLDVGSMHLITSADAPEELIYAITKAVYEHREQVVAQHPAGRAINPRNVVRDTGTEFHPGAVRFYREIGIWPEP